MEQFRGAKFVNITLVLFVWMILNPSAYASPGASESYASSPRVYYVTPEQANHLEFELRQSGYEVRRGSADMLDQLYKREGKSNGLLHLAQNEQTSKKECDKEKSQTQTGQEEQDPQCPDEPAKTEQPEPRPEPEPIREPRTSGSIQIHGSGHLPSPDLPEPPAPDLRLPDFSGGNGDAAAILFVVVGVVVVAVLVVYAIKSLVSIASGKKHHQSWELTLQSNVLAADRGEHGRFHGAKLGAGYIADKYLYLGLVGELGYMDIDLEVEKENRPTRLQLAGSYWMMGAAIRLGRFYDTQRGVLSAANYFFMEFMGGTSEYAATDIIGSAKLGGNFKVSDHLRLGFSVGSRYIGLNEDDGFVNSNNNYWSDFGVDIGYRFGN